MNNQNGSETDPNIYKNFKYGKQISQSNRLFKMNFCLNYPEAEILFSYCT